MYLFAKAKESIARSLHSDKTSPLAKLTSICKFLLKIVIVLSFSFAALIGYSTYFASGADNPYLLKTFAILNAVLGLIALIILKRTNGPYTLAKIKLYPFSMKDLVDISLSTGVVTISVIDILMGYLYLLLSFVIFLLASFLSYECLNDPTTHIKDNEDLNGFCIQFSSVLFMGLYLIAQIGIFRSMPYHPVEYLSFILKNVGEDIVATCKGALKFLF